MGWGGGPDRAGPRAAPPPAAPHDRLRSPLLSPLVPQDPSLLRGLQSLFPQQFHLSNIVLHLLGTYCAHRFPQGVAACSFSSRGLKPHLSSSLTPSPKTPILPRSHIPVMLATFPTIPASFPFLSLPACADLPPPAPTAPPLRPPFPVLLSDHASPDLLQECLLTSATAPRPSEQLLLPLSVQAEEAGKMPGFWVLRSPHPKKLCFLHVSRCRD